MDIEGSLENRNQIIYLQKLLPEYKYVLFEAPNLILQQKQVEGIGILSRYPILDSQVLKLSQEAQDTDKNKRVCLRAHIHSPIGKLQFFLTHFSYGDMTQCRHVVELYRFINASQDSNNQILVGDFNTYYDFEYPMDLLIGKVNHSSRCIPVWESQNFKLPVESKTVFKDVWLNLRSNEAGLTFLSNIPGFDSCRPDRILRKGSCWADKAINIRDGRELTTMQLSDHHAVFATFEKRPDCIF